MVNGSYPSLADAKSLLERDGKHPVFLHINARKKGPEWTGWAKITHAETLSPDYQRLLCSKPNTGILLGEPSDNLCAFDFDTEAGRAAFLQINASFQTTFTTHGERGAQLWAYILGPRPHQIHLIKVHKDSSLAAGAKKGADENGMVQIGEYRAEGGQSVILGIHPSGCHYTWPVSNSPITIAWDDIQWPNDIAIPWEKERKASGKNSNSRDDASLLKRAIDAISVEWLWDHFKLAERRTNPVASPFRSDNTPGHPSFSIYDQGRRFKDHNASYLQHRGDSYDFYQLHTGTNASEAFIPFVELAGLGHELAKNKASATPCRDPFSSSAEQQFDEEHCRSQQPVYPLVDWQKIRSGGKGAQSKFIHTAIYPKDSILTAYVEHVQKVSEGADSFILGSILPVVASALARRVYFPWDNGPLYPNLFSILVGRPGDRKSSTIKSASKLAIHLLPNNAFLPSNISTEALFDEYYEAAGGRADKFWPCDDANVVLANWKNSSHGERVSSQFLRLFDCAPLDESFVRNRKTNEGKAKRMVKETSTSILFGSTFNAAAFQGTQVKQGMARRFLYYVSEGHARLLVLPNQIDFRPVIDLFKPLLALRGEMCLSNEAFQRWASYQAENRQRIEAADPAQEVVGDRLNTCPTWVLKIAMLFEACMAVHYGDTETREISKVCIELAIEHIEQNLRSAEFVDKISEQRSIREEAEIILAVIRDEFKPQENGTIYATRSQLTRRFCSHGRGQNLSVDDLYLKFIPSLQEAGLATIALEKGNMKIYAFAPEEKLQP